jgi:hypothetical protein
MNDETWLTADEAVKEGFADDTVDHGKIAAKMEGCKIVGRFTKLPEALMLEKEESTESRKLEEDLRDAGYSKAEALAIVADGWKAVGRSESAPTERSDSAKKPVITPAMLISEMDL